MIMLYLVYLTGKNEFLKQIVFFTLALISIYSWIGSSLPNNDQSKYLLTQLKVLTDNIFLPVLALNEILKEVDKKYPDLFTKKNIKENIRENINDIEKCIKKLKNKGR